MRFRGLLFALGFAATETARAEPVDLELIFINDTSGSITPHDYSTMIGGYVAAFEDPALIELIQRGRTGAIAVALAFYSERFRITVDWMRVHDAASARGFARAVSAARRPSLGINDGLAKAVDAAAASFADNGYEGARRVVDVVMEGADDHVCGARMDCPHVRRARDAALAGGVTAINGLFMQDRRNFGNRPGDRIDAIAYGDRNLIAGQGSFSVFIDGIERFGAAIRAKIEREVKSAPPPPPEVTIRCCH